MLMNESKRFIHHVFAFLLLSLFVFFLQYLEERENYSRIKKELDVLKEGKNAVILLLLCTILISQSL